MISPYTIQRIKEEARIDEVVGEFVLLKKRGSTLMGNCPFHNEKTPSFHVSVTKGIYKCFGCGKAGDSVKFLMENQQMNYVESLKYLAKKYHIEIEEIQVSEEEKKVEEEKQSQQESILIANSFAQKFFTDYMLHNESGKIGLAYFLERGFNHSIIEKFQLGFSPNEGSSLTEAALKNSFQLDVLKKAGLTSSKENSKFDFFRNRVMFPIHNLIGKVIAFGGRIMIKDEKAPKYINTPESDVYIKGKILYGIFQSKSAIKKQDECYLVEGYTDVVSLHQGGIENVVASSGTALTTEQIKLVKRFTNNLTLLYDGDAAGIKAALRGTDMILEEGMNVRVVIFPDNDDPDSFIRKQGATNFENFIKSNKKDLILFKTSLFAEEAKADPIKKAELIKDIVHSIAKIPDLIQRSVYVKECASQLGIAEQILITEVNKLRRKKIADERKENIDPIGERQDAEKVQQIQSENTTPSVNALLTLEKEIVRLLMEFGAWEIYLDEQTTETVAKFVLEELEGISFETPYKIVVQDVHHTLDRKQAEDPNYFLHHADKEIEKIAEELLMTPYELSEGWWRKFEILVPDKKVIYTKEVQSVLLRFKLYKTLEQLQTLEKMLETETDEKKVEELLAKTQILNKQKKEYADEAGIVVYRPDLSRNS